MDKNERDNLYISKYRKRIKNKELAEHIGVTSAMVSMFFNNKTQMSQDNLDKLIHYIESK